MDNNEAFNPGPARMDPHYERPEWAQDLVPSMTHGIACPLWNWLSGGYVRTALERAPSRDKKYPKTPKEKQQSTAAPRVSDRPENVTIKDEQQ